MAKLQYTTSAKAAREPGKVLPPVPFTLDGRDYIAHPPEEAELALLFSAMGDMDPEDEDTIEPQHIGALLDFFFARLTVPDARYLKKRLRSRKDPFDLESIESIFFDMIGEWTGHPTESSSDSTPPPEPTGPTSSEPSPKSI